MEMTNEQILEVTFAQMPNEFTSNEFTNKLRKNRYDNRWIANHDNVKYLQQHAIQLSLRRWKKLDVRIDTSVNINKIQEAIDLIKSQGFRVMKKVTDWQEI
jgi:hypothetical protein